MSSIKIDDIINFAKANNQTHVCLTDTNLYGAIEFYNKAKANNLKPIIGLNIKYNNQDVYLIAKNNNGYKNLIKISSHSLSNEQFDLNVYSSDLFIFSVNIVMVLWVLDSICDWHWVIVSSSLLSNESVYLVFACDGVNM